VEEGGPALAERALVVGDGNRQASGAVSIDELGNQNITEGHDE
jgi:hypothetical protein